MIKIILLSGCVQPLMSQHGHFSLVLIKESEIDYCWSLHHDFENPRFEIQVAFLAEGQREALMCQQGKQKERHSTIPVGRVAFLYTKYSPILKLQG